MVSVVGIANYTSILLGYADIFIALFIMVYAYLFLKKTNEHKDRRPWDFLFVASVLYLIFQIFNTLYVSGVTTIMSEMIDIDVVRNVFAFLFSGCILLAFISQHDLILRSQLILISKKESKTEKKEVIAEKDVELKVGFDNKKQEKKTEKKTETR